jgi:5-enolpyruvylshikimate-3-phosphate synthase
MLMYIGCMPTILKIGSYKFFFYSHEGSEPPHIHIRNDSSSAKFWLKNGQLVRSSGFNPSELNQLKKYVLEHQNFLLEAWYGYFSSSIR